MTELIFEGFFNQLDVPSVAAVLACMLECERVAKSPPLTPELAACFAAVQVRDERERERDSAKVLVE